MDDLFAARSQMAMSLGFHIIFAIVGMAMPLLMVIAEGLWLRTGDDTYKALAKKWSKGTAILFAVGAVSGTALSFELGLLWPEFMAVAGPVIGLPFSLEGFAFFLEAIFLGIYLYGWTRVSPSMHLFSGVMVTISGTLSGVFVVCANAWMNTPQGFSGFGPNGFTDIDPVAAMFNPAAGSQGLHMAIAAFQTVGFAVAAIHAYLLLKEPKSAFHLKAFFIALSVGSVAALVQPLSGHHSAQVVAETQPAKLAAMEALFETQTCAPLLVGGWPDEQAKTVSYGIHLPCALSLMAFNDPHAEVKGLDNWPKEDWAPVAASHLAFQIMVGLGSFMAAIAALAMLLRWRRPQLLTHPLFLKAVIMCGPMGFIAVEAGWTVTEVGRQPWIIHNIMRTSEAVTPMPHLAVPFLMFTGLYFILGVVVVQLLRQQVFSAPVEDSHV